MPNCFQYGYQFADSPTICEIQHIKSNVTETPITSMLTLPLPCMWMIPRVPWLAVCWSVICIYPWMNLHFPHLSLIYWVNLPMNFNHQSYMYRNAFHSWSSVWLIWSYLNLVSSFAFHHQCTSMLLSRAFYWPFYIPLSVAFALNWFLI